MIVGSRARAVTGRHSMVPQEFFKGPTAPRFPEHIDLKNGTMVYRRKKTSVMRVGVFWTRTTKALKKYQAKHDHGLATVFATYYRGGYSPLAKSTMNAQFGKIRDKAGLTVKMDQLRDGGQTAAIQGGADPIHTDILMGHQTGIKDNYLARNAKMTSDSVAAIEAHYFGGKK